MTDRKHGEILLGRAIHRTAERFSIFENEHWRAFFKWLRPSYELPGRSIIGGRMLQDEY